MTFGGYHGSVQRQLPGVDSHFLASSRGLGAWACGGPLRGVRCVAGTVLGALCGAGGLRIQAVAFSRCYKLTNSPPARFALKVVPRGENGAAPLRPRKKVEREIALHSRLRHRNIVAFHGLFADHVYVVVEFCSRQQQIVHGDLKLSGRRECERRVVGDGAQLRPHTQCPPVLPPGCLTPSKASGPGEDRSDPDPMEWGSEVAFLKEMNQVR
ncbi:Serine/threonine-protein kinase PLK2 [Manis javanica]|nr:Serine/threonine-protein kinase PLK2 [Manis javanica]